MVPPYPKFPNLLHASLEDEAHIDLGLANSYFQIETQSQMLQHMMMLAPQLGGYGDVVSQAPVTTVRVFRLGVTGLSSSVTFS